MINLEMKIKKKFLKNILIQNLLGFLVAVYIFLVKITSTIKYENQDIPKKFWKNEADPEVYLSGWRGCGR